MKTIASCEVCDSTDLLRVLNLGSHPLCDDLVEIEDNRECIEYAVEILFCEKCATAHQRFQVPKVDLFPDSYHYRSRLTADVLSGMRGLVESVNNELKGGLRNRVVLDVGSNDGSLLDIFAEFGATTIGIEPTGAASDSEGRGHDIYKSYFDSKLVDLIKEKYSVIDVITFTNVFAHIEDLNLLLKNLEILMGPNTLLVVENHYLGSVLRNSQFDTFYHEHPRTYSAQSFVHIAKKLHAKVRFLDFPHRYGGNIRVFISKDDSDIEKLNLESILSQEKNYVVEFENMTNFIELWKAKKRAQIDQLVGKYGPLPAKAFPGRAAILIKLLNLDSTEILTVYEKPGSPKIGHYVPGTRIPISSDVEANFAKLEVPIINLAWHISAEIHQYLHSVGLQTEIIEILELDLV
jgi:hypothetical protein